MSSENYIRPRRRELDNAIYGIANGEEGSLKVLYNLSGSAIYAYALTLTGNVYDAEDVMQETLVKIYDASPNYVSRGNPMGWILRIAKNLCFDKFRARSRFETVSDEQLERQLATTNADAEERLLIRSCLDKLDEDERAIVVMHAVGGMRHREIASERKIPLNTTLSKYKRALVKLRKVLEGEEK